MARHKESSFLKNSIAYSISNIVSQLILFFRDLFTRRILPPEIMGFWSFVGVTLEFLRGFDFGFSAGMTRELPIIKGKKDRKEEIRVRSTAFWGVLIQNIIIFIFFFFYVWSHHENYISWKIVSAYVGMILFLILSVSTTYMGFFTCSSAFVPLSKLIIVNSIMEGVSLPLGAYFWGLKGIMFMAVICASLRSLTFFIYGNFLKFRIRLVIYKNIIKRLLSFGFLLRLIDYPGVLFGMINMLWVARLMNIESLALFSLARGFSSQISDTTTKAGTVYAMRFLEHCGNGTARELISRQLKQFLLMQLLVIVPLLSIFSGILFPFIVRNFIPKYSDAIPSILILLICTFFHVLNSGLTNLWVFEKRLKERGMANAFGLIIMSGLLIMQWFVFGLRSIEAIACTTLIAYFLYFSYMVIMVGKNFWKVSECLEIIALVACAALWTSALLFLGNKSISANLSFINDLKATSFSIIWTFICLLPITILGLKLSKGWSFIFAKSYN